MSVSRTAKKTAKAEMDAPVQLRACPFCGGKMVLGLVPSVQVYGAECTNCRALAPTELDPLRAAMANNRRALAGDWHEDDPADDPPPPTLDAPYWWQRLNDTNDVCEVRVVHEQHGPGYWAGGVDGLRRKIDALNEAEQTGWTLDIRSLLHGERSTFTLEQARAILPQNTELTGAQRPVQ